MRKYLWISAVILFIDQLTKTVAEHFLNLGQSIKVLPFFDITLVYNYGASFGFLSDQGGWQRWFLLALAIFVVIFLFRWLFTLKPNETLIAWSLSLIIGGALGNIIDRIYYGYVIDFLDFFIGDKHWPAFNIADSAIVIGAGLMIWDMLKNPKKS